MADHDGSIANTVQILEMYIQNSAGKKADISTCFQLLKIYENIFTFYLTGYILVSDSFDYQANLPIIGGERLSISFMKFKNFPSSIGTSIHVWGKSRYVIPLLYSTLSG